MDENGYRFGVGVLVLASIIIGILLVVFFGAVPAFWMDTYRVTINFEQTPGVDVDTPVQKNGVQIGRVADRTLLPDDGGVNLMLELEREYELKYSDMVRIKAGSIITGDAIVEFVAPAPERSLLARFDGAANMPRDGILQSEEREFADERILDDAVLPRGEVNPDPMEVVVNIQSDFGNALGAIEQASRKVESLAGNLEKVLGGGSEDFSAVVDETRQAIRNFNSTSESIQRVVQQVEEAELPALLGNALREFPDVLIEAEKTVAQARSTLQTIEGAAGSFGEVGETANQVLGNVRDFTDPLKNEGQRAVRDVLMTVNNLNDLITDLKSFAGRLNQGNGTVARLLDDDRLYFEAVDTLQNVKIATRRARLAIENIELATQKVPAIIDDVRIFTDKAARDPGQFGARGILSGRPYGAGIK